MSNYKTIKIICKDDENRLEKLLRHIEETGDFGHSFRIIVDPDDEPEVFWFDGDGSDYIHRIEISEEEQEEEKPFDVERVKSLLMEAKKLLDGK